MYGLKESLSSVAELGRYQQYLAQTPNHHELCKAENIWVTPTKNKKKFEGFLLAAEVAGAEVWRMPGDTDEETWKTKLIDSYKGVEDPAILGNPFFQSHLLSLLKLLDVVNLVVNDQNNFPGFIQEGQTIILGVGDSINHTDPVFGSLFTQNKPKTKEEAQVMLTSRMVAPGSHVDVCSVAGAALIYREGNFWLGNVLAKSRFYHAEYGIEITKQAINRQIEEENDDGVSLALQSAGAMDVDNWLLNGWLIKGYWMYTYQKNGLYIAPEGYFPKNDTHNERYRDEIYSGGEQLREVMSRLQDQKSNGFIMEAYDHRYIGALLGNMFGDSHGIRILF